MWELNIMTAASKPVSKAVMASSVAMLWVREVIPVEIANAPSGKV